jgi:hypothetical protein
MRKAPIDLSASTRSGGIRRAAYLRCAGDYFGCQFPDIGEQTLAVFVTGVVSEKAFTMGWLEGPKAALIVSTPSREVSGPGGS